MGAFESGFVFAGGCFCVALIVTAIWLKFFPNSWLSRRSRQLFGEPDSDPFILLAPARDADPRVFLTVDDDGTTRQWDRVIADVDHLVRVVARIEAAYQTQHPAPHRRACWRMTLTAAAMEQLLRQLALLAEDLRTVTVIWWDARPYRVLRTEPVTGEIPKL